MWVGRTWILRGAAFAMRINHPSRWKPGSARSRMGGASRIRESLLRRLAHDLKVPACSTIHAILDHGSK